MPPNSTAEALDALNRELASLLSQRRLGPEYGAIHDEALRLERILAEERGEPYAAVFPLGDVWEGMLAYSPTVAGNAFSCTVVFETKKRTAYAVVSFLRIAGYKLTDISDEIIEGHALIGKGLKAYGSFVVKNSSWLRELQSVDAVHPQHDPERWRKSQHYLLCFKDRMFEAIAQEVQVVGTFATKNEALERTLGLVSSPR